MIWSYVDVIFFSLLNDERTNKLQTYKASPFSERLASLAKDKLKV